jgi:hypothetical protein
MRRRMCLLVLACVAVGFTSRSVAQLGVNVNVGVNFSAGLEIQSVNDFYQPLEPYGEWVTVPNYGRCWRPVAVDQGWRPYTNGHWEWTDCGWYWVSDEPWSWAAYHYGRWYLDPYYGWVWIPATEWAPAWVNWRQSDDYIGWAPCGPVGFDITPSWFAFISIGNFHGYHHSHDYVYGDRRIYSRTREYGIPRREYREIGGRRERVYVNQGPGLDRIRRASGANFTTQPITRVVEQTPVPRTIRQRSDSPIRRQVIDQQTETQWRERRQRSGNQERGNNSSSRSYGPTGNDQQRNYSAPSSDASGQRRNYSAPSSGSTYTSPNYQAPSSTPRHSVDQSGTQSHPGTTAIPQTPTGRNQRSLYHDSSDNTRSSHADVTPTPSTTPGVQHSAPAPVSPATPNVSPTPTQPVQTPPSRTGRQQDRIYRDGTTRSTTPVTPATPQTAPPRTSVKPQVPDQNQTEPAQAPSTPTGRNQSRIYHEPAAAAPTPPAPVTRTPPTRTETPPSTPESRRTLPPSALPPSVRETPLPPTGHTESRTYESVPRAQEHSLPPQASPRAHEVHESVPAATPHSAPAPANPRHGNDREDRKDRDRDH